MSTPAKNKLSKEEYLEIERQAETKSEYYQGELFAMAGASFNHLRISTNLTFHLKKKLSKLCTIMSSDIRLFIPEFDLFTYPDILTVCGEFKEYDKMKDTILNPNLIIEILSDSTENYDRGQKFKFYRSIESLQEYMLVSQKTASIELYRKNDEGNWTLYEANGMDSSILLKSVKSELAVSDIYEDIDFAA